MSPFTAWLSREWPRTILRSVRCRPRRLGYVTVISMTTVGLAWHANPLERDNAQSGILQLLRSYTVWTLLSIPSLVDSSHSILNFALNTSIPFASSLTETVIRATFFAQFIPGETAEQCASSIETLRRQNIGSALNYSAEADAKENVAEDVAQMRRFKEIERAIKVQGDIEGRMQAEGWDAGASAFAVKVSGLIDPDTMRRVSDSLLKQPRRLDSIGLKVPYPGFPSEECSQILSSTAAEDTPGHLDLSPDDRTTVSLLWKRLDFLAGLARLNGVRFILDAEETWLNPLIDTFTLLLSMKYNSPQETRMAGQKWDGPVVFGTYQSYLLRQPMFLEAAINHAESRGYALGLKVVRGGYIVKERHAGEAKGLEGNGAVWATKPLTDKSYNDSIQTILKTLTAQLKSDRPDLALSVIFGTHNSESVETIIEALEEQGLATRTERGYLRLRPEFGGHVAVAQLYGMREDLSDIVKNTFEPSRSAMVFRFIAYGTLRETLPFLSRRAIENKSVMSGPAGAAAERRRVGAELRRRLSFGILR